MIGQGKHGRAALALILVDCLRMEMMNVPITSCVDLIIALASSHLLPTVVLNLNKT